LTIAEDSVETFIDEGLPFFASRITPEKIKQLDGFIQEVKFMQPGGYDDPNLLDTHYVFTLKGLKVWLLCPEATTKECMFVQIELSQSGQNVKFGLDIGTSSTRIIQLLGEPRERKNGEWTYGEESSQVTFNIENRKIKSIRWDMYTG
jgi:hypothetical protein